MKVKKAIIITVSILVILALIVGINVLVINKFKNQNKEISDTPVNTQVGGTEYMNENNNINIDNSYNIEDNNQNVSTVYMTTNISSEGLMKIYQELSWQPTRKSSS